MVYFMYNTHIVYFIHVYFINTFSLFHTHSLLHTHLNLLHTHSLLHTHMVYFIHILYNILPTIKVTIQYTPYLKLTVTLLILLHNVHHKAYTNLIGV